MDLISISIASQRSLINPPKKDPHGILPKVFESPPKKNPNGSSHTMDHHGSSVYIYIISLYLCISIYLYICIYIYISIYLYIYRYRYRYRSSNKNSMDHPRIVDVFAQTVDPPGCLATVGLDDQLRWASAPPWPYGESGQCHAPVVVLDVGKGMKGARNGKPQESSQTGHCNIIVIISQRFLC